MNESIVLLEKRKIYLGFIRDDLDLKNVSFSELSDDFEVIFDSVWIKILGCVICLLMVTFNNACCILVCLFEKYGGDPMKRSLKNQIMVQIWYTGIVSNNICSPLITWRLIVGPLNPNIAAIQCLFANFYRSWMFLSWTETIIIKALQLYKFSYMNGVNEDFMARFFLVGNIGLLFLCHISR